MGGQQAALIGRFIISRVRQSIQADLRLPIVRLVWPGIQRSMMAERPGQQQASKFEYIGNPGTHQPCGGSQHPGNSSGMEAEPSQ
jgi:hypothetical protein